MKKGKRQIVDKNFFQNEQPSNEETNIPSQTLTNSLPSSLLNEYSQPTPAQPQRADQPTFQKKQPGDDTSISPISEQKSKTSKGQPSNDDKPNGNPSEQKDEKKSRIEMLKQKYLKKSDPKPSNTQSSILTDQNHTEQKNNEYRSGIDVGVEEKREKKEQAPSRARQEIKKIQIPERVQVQAPKINEQQFKKTNEAPYIQGPEETVQKEEIVQVDKDVKKSFKVPPPPPPKKGLKNPTPPPVSAKEVRQSQSPSKEPEQSEPSSVPLIQMVKARQRNQPPPPKKQSTKSNTLQEIISKRLKKDEAPSTKADIDDNYVQPEIQAQSCVDSSLVPSSMPLDEEYIDKKTEKKGVNVQQPLQKSAPSALSFDVSSAFKVWCNDPDNFFTRILPKDDELLTWLQRTTSPELHLTSKNTSYSPIISRFVAQFVFHCKSELTDSQKQVLNDVSLQYYYSDINTLTTEFLLILIKLGESSLSKYIQFFKKNLNRYCKTILNYRTFFLPQQLTIFVNFILQRLEIAEDIMYLLILIQPTQQLLSFLSARSIEDEKSLILSLGASHYLLKTNKAALGIHLRLINNLMDVIPQENSLLEGILKHLNHLESQQKYYSFQKQLKLKLINMLSNTANKIQQAPERDRDPKDEGTGFMGIWNKAIDKFKTATTQFADKEKPIKGQQTQPQTQEPEPPEDDITYDPVLKRYLINGKVPEDDDHRPNPTGSVKAPPPPPPKTNKPTAPPPPGKRKTVTAINRYA